MSRSSNPEYFVMAAGAIALTAGFAEQKRFPDNGYKVIGGTLALTVLASATKGSNIEPLVRAFALLMLLASVYAYVPAFKRETDKRRKPRRDKKGKHNG